MDNKIILVAIGALLLKDKIVDSDDLFRSIKEVDEDTIENGIEIISKSKKYLRGEDKKFLSKIESFLDVAKGVQKLNNASYKDDDTELFRGLEGKDKMNLMIKEIIEVLPNEKKDVITKFLDMKNKMSLLGEFVKIENSEKPVQQKKENISNVKHHKGLKALSNFISMDIDQEECDEESI